jgi:hypothetical protein
VADDTILTDLIFSAIKQTHITVISDIKMMYAHCFMACPLTLDIKKYAITPKSYANAIRKSSI